MSCVVIGLTGQSGAGKSMVRDWLFERGATVINADELAHDIVDNNIHCLLDIAEKFSCIVLNDKGKLDRKRLGRLVFSDKNKLATLNKIMFPYIVKEITDIIEEEAGAGAEYLAIDAPVLFESGADKLCNTVVVVTANEKLRLKRIMDRDGLSKRDAENRINAQHEEKFYTENADFVINNEGDEKKLFEEAEKIFTLISVGEFKDRIALSKESIDEADVPKAEE